MEEERLKKGFFRRVWYSITKLEKYPNMAAEGVPKAFDYFAKIILIFAIIFSLCLIYQTYNMMKEGITFLKEDFPEFSYNDNTFKLENDIQKSIYDLEIGKIIIDTNDKTDIEINNYIDSINNENSGIIILKDKIVLKNVVTSGDISYKYEDLSNQTGIKEFTKQNIIEYVNSPEIIKLYLSLFITICMYSFVLYFISILFNIFMISIFGYLTSILTRIKMRYAAILNLSIYAMTLSILMEIIYVTINIFIDFNITYFQVAYISVASIYLVAAIFMIKSDFIKRQAEINKIIEVQKEVNKQTSPNEEEKRNEEDKPNDGDEEEPKEEGENKKKPEEPEGSQA